MSDRSYVVLAHIIKFGIPLGLILSVGKIGYAIFLGRAIINVEVLGSSLFTFFLCICFGAILGLFKNGRV